MARRCQRYSCERTAATVVRADEALPLDEYLEQVGKFEGPLLFLGDGVKPCREQIEKALGNRARFAPPHLLLPGAGAAAHLASLKPELAVEPGDLKPLYLRAPQAERLRAAKHG